MALPAAHAVPGHDVLPGGDGGELVQPGGPGAAPQRGHIEDSPVIAPLSAGPARVVRRDRSDQISERVGEKHAFSSFASRDNRGRNLWDTDPVAADSRGNVNARRGS